MQTTMNSKGNGRIAEQKKSLILAILTTSAIIKITIALLILLVFANYSVWANAKQYKFTNKTGQKANDLHIEFNRSVTFGNNPNDPGTPNQSPTGTFKTASGEGSSTVNLAAGVTGNGVANNGSVVLTFEWNSGSVPDIKKAYWTNGNTLTPGKSDKIGNYLRFNKAQNTWAMNPATGNGQLAVMIDSQVFVFQSTPGDDGLMTAMEFGNFIESLPFGMMLSIDGNTVTYTGTAYGAGPNIEVFVIAQDATQPVMVQLLEQPVPSENIWTTRITPNSARLNWIPDPLADHYRIQGQKVGASSWISIMVPGSAPGFKDISGLVNGNTYQWQIETFYDVGNMNGSGYSFTDEFTTGCGTPDSIWSDYDPATGSITLYWTRVPGSEGYEISGRKLGASGMKSIFVNGNNTSKTLSNLPSDKTYEWRVRSICDIANNIHGAYTPISTFATSFSTSSRLGKYDDPFSASVPETAFNIWPNPAVGSFNIDVPHNDNGNLDVALFDILGREVRDWELTSGGIQKLNIEGIAPGIYQVKVSGTGYEHITKLRIMTTK